jgi:mono/diheme cytochrome c family protein
MLLACTLVTASPIYAFPQDLAAGQSLAIEVCSTCHAVLAGEGNDPHPAPLPFERRGVPLPFEDIANTPGITETALFAWMTTSHPTMPNIVLEKKELSDVVSYILSLRRDNSRTAFDSWSGARRTIWHTTGHRATVCRPPNSF